MPITQDLFTITPSPRLRTITKINAVPRIRERIPTAGYARVSTAADTQEGSLVWQKNHLEQIISSNPDYEYAGMYEDDGISGTEAETRPGLQQLIADYKAGIVQRVICKSISRMAQNVTDLLEIIHTFNDLGVTVFFEKERQDTATMGSEFLLSILGTFAAHESKSISDNLKWAWRRKFAKGEPALPCAPYGYEKVGSTPSTSTPSTLVINEPEAEMLDTGQKKRARLMYETFGEETFSLEMVVATLDYSSSTASAYLHQFTLLRILDCRKEDVNLYQFLVNPREHPEIFEEAA